MKRMVALMTLGLALVATMASAQDMMRDVDLTSPAMVSAEMSRQEVEAILAKASAGAPADFTGKRLSGLDLSGLDLFHGDSPCGTTQQDETRRCPS